jgi:hypothetical protein
MTGSRATNGRTSIIIRLFFLVTTIGLVTLCGCGFGGPRARLGCLPTATFGIAFPDPNKLGKHVYGFTLFSETTGIVYTCRGGHLDLDHIRGSADNTRYLVKKIRKTLSKNRNGFSFRLTGEMSSHKIRFTYPADWDERPDKDKIIDDIAYNLGPYLSFNATVWHEIQTWFGVHFALLEPEFNSAFSWEDIYSNLIGTRLGIEAMKDTELSYDKAMTAAIYRQLKELGVQPSDTAYAASDKVRGTWYTGNLVPDMKMRNFDIGLDGSVTPTLVPGINGCGSRPMTLPAPSTSVLEHYGFSMTYEIKPNLLLEQGRIFKAAGSKKIFPDKHFPILIEYMKNKALERGDNFDE